MDYKEKYENETGFKFKTSVREDFTEAEYDDEVGVEELYRKLFRKWRNDVEKVAELSMCLNWKLREHYRKKDECSNGEFHEGLAQLYNDLWMRVDTYAKDVFIGDEGSYYFKVTD